MGSSKGDNYISSTSKTKSSEEVQEPKAQIKDLSNCRSETHKGCGRLIFLLTSS